MNFKLIVTALIIGILSFWSCKPSGTTEQKKMLSVTIDPQKYFLDTIVGNHYDVNCVIPSGSNPESADFTPSQMLALGKSIAYFKIGYLGIENTLIDKVSKSNPDLKVIDCSVGIEPVGDIHNHEDESHERHYAHAGGDPHTWSSVKSARIIARNMYEGVLELDETNKDDYKANYDKLLSEINRTDSIIKIYLGKAPSKSFIIYHPALSYFADEYGLTQYSIENDGKNPSPSQLKALIDTAKEEGIKVVFIQQEYDTKNAETVANAIGANIISLNLLSYNWSEEMIKIAKALALEE